MAEGGDVVVSVPVVAVVGWDVGAGAVEAGVGTGSGAGAGGAGAMAVATTGGMEIIEPEAKDPRLDMSSSY